MAKQQPTDKELLLWDAEWWVNPELKWGANGVEYNAENVSRINVLEFKWGRARDFDGKFVQHRTMRPSEHRCFFALLIIEAMN